MRIGATVRRKRLLDHVQNQLVLELLLCRKKLLGGHRGPQRRHHHVELFERSFAWRRDLARKLDFFEFARLELALTLSGAG
jgi:hypothetical protein